MPIFRPGKPKWRAGLDADVVLAAGVQTITTWVMRWQEGGDWDGGERFTVDRPGTYLVTLQLNRLGTASSSNLIARISHNDVSNWQGTTVTTAGGISLNLVALIACAAGDTIRAECRLHTTISATLEHLHTHFAGTRVAPERWT